MAELIIPNFLHYLNFLQVAVLLMGTFVASIVAICNNHVSLYVPFISETGAMIPEMNIFSLTLILGCILGITLMLHRYVVIFLTTANDNKMLIKSNEVACLCGLFSMLGLAGVAAFPVSTVFSVHMVFASSFFGGVLLYTMLTTFYTYKSGSSSAGLLKFRVILSILILLTLIFLIILFPISFKNWLSKHNVPPAVKQPGDEGFTLILVSSCLEWFYMMFFLMYLAQINKDLPKESLKLLLTSSRNRSETDLSSPVVSTG